jgi:hypothetical protein
MRWLLVDLRFSITQNGYVGNDSRKPPTPYFEVENINSPASVLGSGPDVLFVDFLARLSGSARVAIDVRQEMLIMLLRARCLKYALSRESDEIIPAINQLCAIYEQAAIRTGLKSFEVFRRFYEEYVKIQEQVFLAREQAQSKDQRPVQETSNLLNHVHDLLEGLLRRLATLGMFSLDVLSANPRANDLSPTQYLDLPLTEKDQTFTDHRSVLTGTRNVLFGSIRHDIRNAIAHRRYEVQEDGSALLFDFNPRTKQRRDIGRVTKAELESLIDDLQRAVDVFEISLLIFQHNHGSFLNQLGYYGPKKEYTDKEMTEMLYIEAPAALLSVEEVLISEETVKVTLRFTSQTRSSGSEVFVRSKDRDGKPITYSLPIPPRTTSARDQTFRFLQKCSFYCGRYKKIEARTLDADNTIIGEVVAPMELLVRSTQEVVPKETFIKGLLTNTFQPS